MPNIEEIDAASDDEINEQQDLATNRVKKSNLKEQLNENNWADWTRCIVPVLEVCEV
jgi:hypothetical protein